MPSLSSRCWSFLHKAVPLSFLDNGPEQFWSLQKELRISYWCGGSSFRKLWVDLSFVKAGLYRSIRVYRFLGFSEALRMARDTFWVFLRLRRHGNLEWRTRALRTPEDIAVALQEELADNRLFSALESMADATALPVFSLSDMETMLAEAGRGTLGAGH